MTAGDVIVLAVLGLVVGAIAGSLWQNRKRGCCGSCDQCDRCREKKNEKRNELW